MTVLTGGTLGYLNEHSYLVQNRDANLGPRGKTSPAGTPKELFLALVVEPGTSYKAGKVLLGKTKLVQLEALEQLYTKGELPRGADASVLWVGLDDQCKPVRIAEEESDQTPWKLKLSGRPVNRKGKREGIFLAGTTEPLDLPAELWAAFTERNVHGDKKEFRAGDLVWLEPVDPEATCLAHGKDVKSIQWSRWGKRGRPLKERVRHEFWPDYLKDDGLVDAVTDLFGQVSTQIGVSSAFAARVRPDNLVFLDAAAKVERVTLAPLAPPHPGCVAFYRDNENPDGISEADMIRGYKVYRTQIEEEPLPWRYETQGVYDSQGKARSPKRRVNKTCDLLPKGFTGQLSLSFRGLTAPELALVIQACQVPWRLGGGKPLGLGLCTVSIKGLFNEVGERLEVPNWIMTNRDGALVIEGWEKLVGDIQTRVKMWEASQKPVPKLRYPRAVDQNKFSKTRGGHTWFQRHAKPRMVTREGLREPGLEPLYIGGETEESAKRQKESLDPTLPMIAGQLLPHFKEGDPQADVLYGYDAFGVETEERENPSARVFLRIEAFDPTRHITGEEGSEGNQGKNAAYRASQKKDRTAPDSSLS